MVNSHYRRQLMVTANAMTMDYSQAKHDAFESFKCTRELTQVELFMVCPLALYLTKNGSLSPTIRAPRSLGGFGGDATIVL